MHGQSVTRSDFLKICVLLRHDASGAESLVHVGCTLVLGSSLDAEETSWRMKENNIGKE